MTLELGIMAMEENQSCVVKQREQALISNQCSRKEEASVLHSLVLNEHGWVEEIHSQAAVGVTEREITQRKQKECTLFSQDSLTQMGTTRCKDSESLEEEFLPFTQTVDNSSNAESSEANVNKDCFLFCKWNMHISYSPLMSSGHCWLGTNKTVFLSPH